MKEEFKPRKIHKIIWYTAISISAIIVAYNLINFLLGNE